MRNNRSVVEGRQEELLRLVMSSEEISVEDLAEKLGVSAMTIRRDLSILKGIRRTVPTGSAASQQKCNKRSKGSI